MWYLLQGLTMGLAYVAPIGVQNLFVIHTALTGPRRRALGTAGIVIFFDVSLALACFFGVGAAMEAFPILRGGVLLVGSLVVLAIGVGLLRDKGELEGGTPLPATLPKTISTACLVTWCNPQALVDGTLMLGAFRASLPATQAAPFICGVGLASCLWFLGLTLVVSLLSCRFTPRVVRLINRICGVWILFYGGKLLWSFLAMM
ncbi:MAG: LysE family transporter [Clostridiales bacterium]|nr:LysE family transporter [Clostridiales bacterium]